MRRRGRNARRTAAASDQGARRRAAEREHVASPAAQGDSLGPWSHGRGVAIKQQQLERSPPPHHQYYPSGQFHLMSSSPIALTPSLSPLYKVPAPNYYSSATAASAAQGATATAAALSRQPLDETIGRIFTTYLPNFFDALGKFQYHQALASFECEGKTEWRSWDAFSVMRKLAASCESTYHLMKYLEPDVLHSDAIDLMYSKLVVLLNHLAEELKPLIAQQLHYHQHAHHFPVHSMSSASTPVEPLGDIAMCGDLGYYAELLDQAAEFFSLRLPMIEMYRSLALATAPLDCHYLLRMLDGLLVRLDAFDHPLLETMKQSAMEENRAVYAAVQVELRITQYDFTKSMVALHRLKKVLASWSEHIDSISDYALFDTANGAGLHGDDEYDRSGRTNEDDDMNDDDENYALSDSIYSNVSFPVPGSSVTGADATSYLSRSAVRRTSYSVAGSDYPGAGPGDELLLLARNPSVMSVESTTSVASEVQSTFSRLLSQSNILKRGLAGVSGSVPMVNVVQRPGDPYASTGSTMLTNTLEQAILGGSGSGSNGTAHHHHGNGNGTGGSSRNLSAAEMIALSMKKQERDDGFLLPVFQWAKRFYRSLVAKFSLYFHQWLEPLERQGDFLTHDLTRFIRTPMGISYLQLMDVLLARGSYRGDDGAACIMLILETEQLENKGAHYYQNGYLCPSTSRARPSQPEPEDPQHDGSSTGSPSSDRKNSVDLVEKRSQQLLLQHEAAAAAAAASSSAVSSVLKSPTAATRPQTNHALFMQVDTEREEEQSDFSPLWGLRGWPAVFCYPNKDPPLAHWPNIVSLIMDNRAALEAPRAVFAHTEKRMKTSYYIARVDPCVHLVLLLEGKRRPTEKTTQDFMQTLALNLQHAGAFDYSRSVSAAPSSAS